MIGWSAGPTKDLHGKKLKHNNLVMRSIRRCCPAITRILRAAAAGEAVAATTSTAAAAALVGTNLEALREATPTIRFVRPLFIRIWTRREGAVLRTRYSVLHAVGLRSSAHSKLPAREPLSTLNFPIWLRSITERKS